MKIVLTLAFLVGIVLGYAGLAFLLMIAVGMVHAQWLVMLPLMGYHVALALAWIPGFFLGTTLLGGNSK